jgi:hypothetical protein
MQIVQPWNELVDVSSKRSSKHQVIGKFPQFDQVLQHLITTDTDKYLQWAWTTQASANQLNQYPFFATHSFSSNQTAISQERPKVIRMTFSLVSPLPPPNSYQGTTRL